MAGHLPGLTAAIGVGEDYLLPQRWGQRTQQAGSAGILYPAAHNLSLVHRSVALFGKPGEHESAFTARGRPVSEEVLAHVTVLGWVILLSTPLAF